MKGPIILRYNMEYTKKIDTRKLTQAEIDIVVMKDIHTFLTKIFPIRERKNIYLKPAVLHRTIKDMSPYPYIDFHITVRGEMSLRGLESFDDMYFLKMKRGEKFHDWDEVSKDFHRKLELTKNYSEECLSLDSKARYEEYFEHLENEKDRHDTDLIQKKYFGKKQDPLGRAYSISRNFDKFLKKNQYKADFIQLNFQILEDVNRADTIDICYEGNIPSNKTKKSKPLYSVQTTRYNEPSLEHDPETDTFIIKKDEIDEGVVSRDYILT